LTWRKGIPHRVAKVRIRMELDEATVTLDGVYFLVRCEFGPFKQANVRAYPRHEKKNVMPRVR
jgi:hypothetical protein